MITGFAALVMDRNTDPLVLLRDPLNSYLDCFFKKVFLFRIYITSPFSIKVTVFDSLLFLTHVLDCCELRKTGNHMK